MTLLLIIFVTTTFKRRNFSIKAYDINIKIPFASIQKLKFKYLIRNNLG